MGAMAVCDPDENARRSIPRTVAARWGRAASRQGRSQVAAAKGRDHQPGVAAERSSTLDRHPWLRGKIHQTVWGSASNSALRVPCSGGAAHRKHTLCGTLRNIAEPTHKGSGITQAQRRVAPREPAQRCRARTQDRRQAAPYGTHAKCSGTSQAQRKAHLAPRRWGPGSSAPRSASSEEAAEQPAHIKRRQRDR